MTAAAPSTLHPWLHRIGRVQSWQRLGDQAAFYAATIGGIHYAFVRHRSEVLRQIAQMSMGVGRLGLVGGAMLIVGFLTFTTGSLIAVQTFSQLQQVGVDAMAGFTSAFFNVRLIAPLAAGIGLTATIGAGATAQMGAMRISEEIDALEAMSVRAITYLCSTRLIAGVVVAVPLYYIAVLGSTTATRLGVTILYGQSTGVYDHYFNSFLNPWDLIRSLALAVVMAVVVMLVHAYYGFTATGGPAGVGEAVGRAVRTSLVVVATSTMFLSLAIYGQSGSFNLAG